ncbi:flagellin lysine-N-methylase [Paenibacillus oceani]|uniref:Flagellin lysine-N-methylase n=1 Tax=Paenibacillus oceani TaxID=2772510 RepID=A0A927C9L3_9BACL|nr:flagellin lysine-N-methylase [Paenibacillus oceani]MBD2863640.1 flagellin lysine-N-methylase [Paenibacillus oceani]
MGKKSVVLVPSYMRKFSCIGSACEDTCCAGWRVDLDKETYKKYTTIKEPDLKRIVDKNVTRNRSNPTDHTYAKIKPVGDNLCPFLNEEKLCSMQLRKGEDYLSTVCSTYPRISNIVNGGVERSATMSCPEAARLALLNPDGIEFDEVEEEVDNKVNLSKVINFSASAKTKLEHYFWELRIFTIQVLQNRKYSVADRLVILGFFYQKLAEIVKKGQIDSIEQTIANFMTIIEEESLQSTIREIPSNTAIQMELLKELADERFFSGINSQRYFKCFGAFLNGIEYKLSDKVEEIAERYLDAYENYYNPFMKDHEYILENYLVNYVFKNMFPLSGSKDMFEEYIRMVLHFALIKMNLIGMARYHKEEFSIDHVIALIQSFSKTVEHNKLFLNHAYKLLAQNEYTTMAYMAVLIKN